ncbi:unnamed protein product [Bursaphelenchus xylophilus]|uniref:(pine wood nematode) hypothetical protein n=1 Tax=Bursaphelenchus xylophilus TaxID=6326 RepID=A0A1I7ST52_BURXY|nr:unnamed protein product [Bursaphelenchus xylophilus]CAG9108727.1 unnamed protein product [Bursaphelenchus xylophilus]
MAPLKIKVAKNKNSTKVIQKSFERSEEDIEDLVSDGRKRFQRDFPLILEMRKGNDAPVDSIGCHMLADKSADLDTQHFQTLTALILSPRVKDQQTAIAMTKLKEHCLTVENIIKTPVEEIQKIISFIGLAKTKAERLHKCAKILHEQYDGKVPNDYEKLMALPGVGDKIASLVMVNCFDSDQFIGVDTHVHRIANMLKWVKTRTPKGTDDALKELVPRSQWRALNVALVGFGQTVCKAPHPRCEICLLNTTCAMSKCREKKGH